jgi:hypothetical protein
VDIAGNLTNQQNQPLNAATVVLSYLIPGVPTWNPLTSVTTGSDGSFIATWQPSATGNFLIKAEWAGNDVNAGTWESRNVSVSRGIGDALFYAESNSTLTALSFNATSREVSFTVGGVSGTTGYVRFLISDALLGNLTDLRVYMDGQETSFTTNTLGNMYSLYFQYNHSKHDVSIKLSTSQIPEFPTWTLLPLLSVFVLFAVFGKKKFNRL